MTVELLSGADDQEKIQQLIEKLVGKGINLIDYQVKGDLTQQFGLFAAGNDLELPSPSFSGVVFSTGNVLDAVDPNDLDYTSGYPGSGGDEDLTNILDGAFTNDAATLEFSFTVNKLSVFNFSYVFGSDEYNEFVNSSFNDVFAFFFKQIGTIGEDGEPILDDPASPNTIDNNIATISVQTTDQNGSLIIQDIPVAINNLNGLTTALLADGSPVSSLYNNNDLDDVAPEDLKNIEYDGFSNILPANTEQLQPGIVYSFKIAIADVSDSAYDSSVFIGGISADTVFAKDDFVVKPVDNTVKINVLKDDTFPKDNTFNGIIQIDGKLVPANGAVTLDSGAVVTLNNNGTPNQKADDFLSYKAASIFHGTDSFSYSIRAGNTKESAQVVVNVGTTILGTPTADNLTGSNKREIIYGLASSDKIKGLGGNDRLIGGGLGKTEIDVLTGGVGADVFVLGSRTSDDTTDDEIVFYNDGQLNVTDKNYAEITDFNKSLDKLELVGTTSDYFVQGSNLFYDLNHNGSQDNVDELIAKFSNNVQIDLGTNAIFV